MITIASAIILLVYLLGSLIREKGGYLELFAKN
jgi:hypothetical protein